MALFGNDSETCVECGVGVSDGREAGASACRCKNHRKAWADRADAAIAAAKANSETRRKAEEGMLRTY